MRAATLSAGWSRWGAALVLLASGCLPAPHSAKGRACDEQHACGDALVCHRGQCRESCARGEACASSESCADGVCLPPCHDSTECVAPDVCVQELCRPRRNLLANGGFEQGLLGWYELGSASRVEVQGLTFFEGKGAARVRAVAGLGAVFGVAVSPNEIAGLTAQLTHCVEARVRAGANVGSGVRLMARAANAQLAGADEQLDAVIPPRDAWQLLRGKLVPQAPYVERLLLSFPCNVVTDGEYFLDGIFVWVDPSGLCAPP